MKQTRFEAKNPEMNKIKQTNDTHDNCNSGKNDNNHQPTTKTS